MPRTPVAENGSTTGRRTARIVIGLAGLAGVGLAAWWYAQREDDRRTRWISVVVIVGGSKNIDGDYLDCHGVGDYASFRPGQPASLVDAGGELAAVATIGDAQTAIERLTFEEETNNVQVGVVSEIHAKAYAKVSKPFRNAAGYACGMHILFSNVDPIGLYTLEIGAHRFPIDVVAAPLFESLVWSLG